MRGVPDGTYVIGRRYRSTFTLTTPILRDQNDKLVGSGHVRLLRLDVAVRNSGHFDVQVLDTPRDVNWGGELKGADTRADLAYGPGYDYRTMSHQRRHN